MDSFAEEFSDILSGRIPKWNKIKKYYPQFQIETHKWHEPFKEGGDSGPDEINIRVATIHKGVEFFQTYIITNHYLIKFANPTQQIINILKKQIKERIKEHDNSNNKI